LRRALAIAALATTLAAPAAGQGPRAIVEALRGTPASLFELSIARLEAYLDSVGALHGFASFANFQDDRLVIFVSAEEQTASEAVCRAIMTRVKLAAAVDPDTGEPFRPASVFASFFNYPRLKSIDIDPTYDETVDGMIDIKVVLGITGDGKGMVCDSPLLSREIKVRRE
jgi:hypothetical protein